MMSVRLVSLTADVNGLTEAGLDITRLDCIWLYPIAVSIITSSEKLVWLSETEAVLIKAQLGLLINEE